MAVVATMQCDPVDQRRQLHGALEEGTGRRRLLLRGGTGLALALFATTTIRAALAADDYGATMEVLRFAHERETTAYHRYVVYSRQALKERYRGIAYLFNAIASSELIYAQNFNRVLSRLGVEIAPFQPPEPKLGDTKANLIEAAAKELNSIDVVYPDILKQLTAGAYQDAIVNATYAWELHKQHRGIIQQIDDYTADHFEEVAKTIDEKSTYHVCQICGSTLTEVPAGLCPICGQPATQYRKIEYFLL